MKKYLLTILTILFFSMPSFSADNIFTIEQDGTFGGGVDLLSPDKIGSKYCPIEGILNVNTDRFNEITKCWGSTLYNSTAWAGLKQGRKAYPYNKANGDQYALLQSSTSLFYTNGGGGFTSITNTLTLNKDLDFTTANDWLYFTNGTDAPGRWNGTTLTRFTVSNSTNYPTNCKYIKNWHSRNWLGGDSVYKNRIYYSYAFVVTIDSGAYENYPIANFLDLGVDDGDSQTGFQVWQDRLLVYYGRKIFEIYEIESGSFGYRLLSNKIGCLYGSTLDILNDLPIFVSNRGIEQFDGSKLELKSLPIDNYVKSLRQLKSNSSVISQDTAADWGAGSGTNIDTTTYSGSVAVTTPTINESNINSASGAGDNHINFYRQSFRTTADTYLSSIEIYGRAENTTSQYFVINITSQNATLGTVVKNINSISTSNNWLNVAFNNISLIAETTYYITISSSSSGNYYWWGYNANQYAKGASEYSTNNLSWATYATINSDFMFRVYAMANSSASYTTQSLNASGWTSWGTFSVDQTVPSGSSINYYGVTSTSTYNLTTNTAFTLTNGGIIASAVGPYMQIISSFTRTDATVVPKLNSLNLTYYGTDANYPQGIVFEDRYYLAVNTMTTSQNNDTIIVMQKTGDFTRYSLPGGCFVNYKDNLYMGDSADTGNMYRIEVPDIYTFNDVAYPSYWTSKKINLHPLYKMKSKELWINAKGITSDLDISYNLDDYNGSWYSDSITLNNTYGINVYKLPILPSTYSRYFQFRVGNYADNDFRIKNLNILYDTVPAVE